jgi:fluoride exporter
MGSGDRDPDGSAQTRESGVLTWLLVALGAAVGAPLRYLADRFVQARHDSVFPWGTFVVNTAGSLVLGALTGAVGGGAAGSTTQALLGTGLCGALTTYSTFSYETLRLAERGWMFLAVANMAATLFAGLGAVFFGLTLTRHLLS